ncbi:MAG: hydantoinase/oxoprolinase family protein [Candidatus Lokiarchaeota archaeon]|nr:hydantoinase/oxoprolinase family protein [Candidatus Lokiarchaeota archaeon]
MHPNSKILGIDVGGTFTDLVLTDEKTGKRTIHKVPTTPVSQEKAVIQGIREILHETETSPESLDLIIHGTTAATNALLERKGAKVSLITTQGMEDIIEIGRQNREEIYSLVADRPTPLVNRDRRIGIAERIDNSGNVILGLTAKEIERVREKVEEINPESIAISLLFSFQNPQHEEMLIDELRNDSNWYVVASHDVLREFREFERTSTTVLEAYLGPVVLQYLERLTEGVTNFCPNATLAIMQSNGGTMLSSEAEGHSIGLAISGLAGGVIGGWAAAKQHSVEKAITVDMGGTSCDVSAVDGAIVVKADNKVAGFPLRVPSVDVQTIGAGGGSIAWIDDAGVLHVGPQSAGADPGPAAYGKGGTEATVTDANLVIGRLNPDYFLGGKLKLHTRKAWNAIENLAEELNLSVMETARGITRISTANMVQAIREVTVERGIDPRNFILVPFGGAGPTQAVDMAEMLQIDTVLVPRYPGITSAVGLVEADPRVDRMRTVLTGAEQTQEWSLLETLEELTEEAGNRLEKQNSRNLPVAFQWAIDMRYSGQSHELTIPVQPHTEQLLRESIECFEERHEQEFGYRMDGRQVEWVTARVAGIAKRPHRTTENHSHPDTSKSYDTRKITLMNGKTTKADVYRRKSLAPDIIFNGPAIVEQVDTTIWIAKGWKAQQSAEGALWIRRSSND